MQLTWIGKELVEINMCIYVKIDWGILVFGLKENELGVELKFDMYQKEDQRDDVFDGWDKETKGYRRVGLVIALWSSNACFQNQTFDTYFCHVT